MEEIHTYSGPNPHRLLLNDLIRDMPRDTTLAVEFPATLRRYLIGSAALLMESWKYLFLIYCDVV